MIRFLRACVVALSITAVVAAIIITAARIVVWQIHWLEPIIKENLESSQTQITELSGGWRGLNPSVHVARLSQKYFTAFDIQAEVDLFESLLRNRVVFARIAVDELNITIDVRAQNGGSIDFSSLLDNPILKFGHTVMVDDLYIYSSHDPDEPIYTGKFASTNQGGDHRLRFELEQSDCRGCRTTWSFDRELPQFFGRSSYHSVQVVAKDFKVDLQRFGIPRVPAITLQTDFAATRNQFDDLEGYGSASLAIDCPEYDCSISTEIFHTDFDSLSTVELRHITLSSTPSNEIPILPPRQSLYHELPAVFISRSAAAHSVAIDEIHVDPLRTFLIHILGDRFASTKWLENATPSGRMSEALFVIDDHAISVTADVFDAKLLPYESVLGFEVDRAELSGDLWRPAIAFKGARIAIDYPQQHDDTFLLENATGNTTFWYDFNRFGFWSNDFEALLFDSVEVDAAFGFNRDLKQPQAVFAMLVANQGARIGSDLMKSLIPRAVPRDTAQWIRSYIHSGVMVGFDWLSFVNNEDGDPSRTHTVVQARSPFRDSEVEYLPHWPKIFIDSGDVDLGMFGVYINLRDGRILDSTLPKGNVNLPFDDDHVYAAFTAQSNPNDLVTLVTTTELQDEIPFVERSWNGRGRVLLDARLKIPPTEGSYGVDDIQVDFEFQETQLEDSELRWALSAINGELRYRSPHTYASEDLAAHFFGEPLELAVRGQSTPSPQIDISTTVMLTAETIDHLFEIEELNLLDGNALFEFDFRARPGENTVVRVDVSSNLEGMQIDFVDPIRKVASASLPTQLRWIGWDFSSDDDTVSGVSASLPASFDLTYQNELSEGALQWRENDLAYAGIGLRSSPPARPDDFSGMLVSGTIDEFQLSQSQEKFQSATPITLSDVTVHQLLISDSDLGDVKVHGQLSNQGIDLRFDGPNVSGSWFEAEEQTNVVRLSYLRWPVDSIEDTHDAFSSAGEVFDPLKPEFVAMIDDTRLEVDSFKLIDPAGNTDDYGSWVMDLYPTEKGLEIENLIADVKGTHIESQGRGVWHTDTNTTSFEVSMVGDNLIDVLPAWGYEPYMESERFELLGQLEWQGSPLAIEPDRVSGSVSVTARDGRFLDLEGGAALRVVSLFNFANVLKRLQLDFEDVTQEGFVFDDITLRSEVSDGLVTFIEPLTIKGPSSEFRMNGVVNFSSQRFDTELIVSLPVNKSIPWYSAALTVLNPVVGIGVLIGAKTLEEPIRTLTSGKYSVTGPIDDPEVTFLSIFDTALTESTDIPQSSNGALTPELLPLEPGDGREAPTTSDEASSPDRGGEDLSSIPGEDTIGSDG